MTAPAPAPADGKTPMTAEDILAALQQILDAADLTDGGALSEDQVQRYESLEAQLAVVSKSNDVRKRHQAYKTQTTTPVLHSTTSKQDDTLERAFSHYLRTGKENADIVELRAQSEGTGSQGGYLVPAGFRNQIVERMKAFGGIANDAESLTTSTGEDLPWPTLDDTANLGEVVNEGGTFTSGADMVFGSANLGAYSYMAGGAGSNPLRIGYELSNDSNFDLAGLVSRKLGERIARLQATHLATGDGVKKPLGLLTNLTGVQITHAGLKLDDLLDVIHTVDPAYRESGCRWAFNDTSLKVIEKLKDSNGDSIWRPWGTSAAGNMGDAPSGGSLLGYPVTIDQSFPGINLASNTVNWGAFGNISEGYVIRRVAEVTLLVNPYSRQSFRQIEYCAWARMDATQQNTNAYTAITAATS